MKRSAPPPIFYVNANHGSVGVLIAAYLGELSGRVCFNLRVPSARLIVVVDGGSCSGRGVCVDGICVDKVCPGDVLTFNLRGVGVHCAELPVKADLIVEAQGGVISLGIGGAVGAAIGGAIGGPLGAAAGYVVGEFVEQHAPQIIATLEALASQAIAMLDGLIATAESVSEESSDPRVRSAARVVAAKASLAKKYLAEAAREARSDPQAASSLVKVAESLIASIKSFIEQQIEEEKRFEKTVLMILQQMERQVNTILDIVKTQEELIKQLIVLQQQQLQMMQQMQQQMAMIQEQQGRLMEEMARSRSEIAKAMIAVGGIMAASVAALYFASRAQPRAVEATSMVPA